MWTDKDEPIGEVRKCRHRVVGYLKGRGLDIGCGNEKINKNAIGIDKGGRAANIKMDVGDINGLRIFSGNFFDYVFSSHALEDFTDTQAILEQWWRLVRPGGHLILYGPDPDYYPRIGTADANPMHQHDLYWQDVWKILKDYGNAKLVSASRHNESNEYSWQLIVRKKSGLLKTPFELLTKRNRDGEGYMLFPRKKKTKKECLLIRYGALGDMLWITPALKKLKEAGYYIVCNCTEYSAQVIRENPYIDEFLIQEPDVIPNTPHNADLDPYWKDIGKGFEKVINLSGSVEDSLLKREGHEDFNWTHDRRHKECNVNYMDRTMALCGFPKAKGELPELYFSDIEHHLAQIARNYYKDKFLILWSLAGSSFHKIYPWVEYVAGDIQKKLDDVRIITVGDYVCQILEWQNPITINKSGVFTVRQSMIMTKYADLVIGTETGILNAASCYDTPKIVLLSHSSVENLTRDWKNCTSLWADNCPCHPCHRLTFSRQVCPAGDINGLATKCMENLKPERVFRAIEKVYNQWKEKRNDSLGVKNENTS